MRPFAIAALLALVPSAASAFGGGFVSTDTAPTVTGSRIIVAHDGERTVLTLAPRVSGGSGDFALIIPTPTVPSADDVRLVAPDTVAAIDAFTAPRLLSYSCDDLHPYGQDTGRYNYYGYGYGYYYVQTTDRVYGGPFRAHSGRGLFSCEGGPGTRWYGPYGEYVAGPRDTGAADTADTDAPDGAGGGTIVTTAFRDDWTEATYDTAVFSADTRDALDAWMTERGLAPTPQQSAVLDEYVAAGRGFVAAAVAGSSAGSLPPLQIAFDGPLDSVPLRLGLAQSPGEQDVVLISIDASDAGRAEVVDWPKTSIPDACMVDQTEQGAFTARYESDLATAIAASASHATDTDTDAGSAWAGWVVEFAGSPLVCDPCPDGPLTTPQLAELGASAPAAQLWVTRLRLRYTVDGVPTDPGLTHAPGAAASTSFIEHVRELESDFPVCGEGYVTNPGTCFSRSKHDGSGVPPRRGIALGAVALGVGLIIRRARRSRR